MIQSYKTTLGPVGSTFTGQLSPGMDFLEVVDAQGTLFFDFADGGRIEAVKSDVLYFSPAAPLPQGFSVTSSIANDTIHLRAGRGRSMRLANAGGGTGTVTIGGPLPLPVTASEQFGTTKAFGAWNVFPTGALKILSNQLNPLRLQEDGAALITTGDVRTPSGINLLPGISFNEWLRGAALAAVRITQITAGDVFRVDLGDANNNWNPAPLYTVQGERRSAVGVILEPGLYLIPCPAQHRIRFSADATNTNQVLGVYDLSRTRESWRPLMTGIVKTFYAQYTSANTFTVLNASANRQYRVIGYKWRSQGNTGTVTFGSGGNTIFASRSSANDDGETAASDGDFLFESAVGGNVTVTLSGSFTMLHLTLRYYELWA